MPICNKDCLHCIHPDCICDELTYEDYVELRQIERECINPNPKWIPTSSKRRRYDKKYYDTHREEILAYQRAYNAEHREEILAKKRAYNAEHREERLAYQREYRRIRAQNHADSRDGKEHMNGN